MSAEVEDDVGEEGGSDMVVSRSSSAAALGVRRWVVVGLGFSWEDIHV